MAQRSQMFPGLGMFAIFDELFQRLFLIPFRIGQQGTDGMQRAFPIRVLQGIDDQSGQRLPRLVFPMRIPSLLARIGQDSRQVLDVLDRRRRIPNDLVQRVITVRFGSGRFQLDDPVARLLPPPRRQGVIFSLDIEHEETLVLVGQQGRQNDRHPLARPRRSERQQMGFSVVPKMIKPVAAAIAPDVESGSQQARPAYFRPSGPAGGTVQIRHGPPRTPVHQGAQAATRTGEQAA